MLPNENEFPEAPDYKPREPMPCGFTTVPITMKLPPPRPELRLELADGLGEPGIILKWHLCLSPYFEEIDFYELYARRETIEPPTTTTDWKKFGVIQALPLPMACTLVQFKAGTYYHFSIRAVDVFMRFGPFSSPSRIQIPANLPNALEEDDPEPVELEEEEPESFDNSN